MSTATQVQIRRGTATQVAGFTGVAGEVTADMTNFALVLHDGIAAGGHRQATEPYVLAQIAAIAVGTVQNLTLASSCG